MSHTPHVPIPTSSELLTEGGIAVRPPSVTTHTQPHTVHRKQQLLSEGQLETQTSSPCPAIPSVLRTEEGRERNTKHVWQKTREGKEGAGKVWERQNKGWSETEHYVRFLVNKEKKKGSTISPILTLTAGPFQHIITAPIYHLLHPLPCKHSPKWN